MKQNREKAIQEDFKDEVIIKSDKAANFFGQKSLGMSQIRGNGVLALLEYNLVFYMWLPKRKLVILLDNIRSATKIKGFLGKVKANRPLLRVEFRNDKDNLDAAAWWVHNLEGWLNKI